MKGEGSALWWKPTVPCEDYLAHYGIKGMKWGVRRYQNKDGTLTSAGKLRYRLDFIENPSKSYINDDLSLTPHIKAKNDAYQKRENDAYQKIYQDNKLTSREKDDKWFKYIDDTDSEFQNKLGPDIYKKVTGPWFRTISNIYDGNYSEFIKSDSEARKTWEKGEKELERLRSEFQDQWKRAEGDPQKMNQVRETKEFKDRVKKYDEIDKLVDDAIDKLAKEYKQATLNDILKEIPANKRDDTFIYIYNFWWNYD